MMNYFRFVTYFEKQKKEEEVLNSACMFFIVKEMLLKYTDFHQNAKSLDGSLIKRLKRLQKTWIKRLQFNHQSDGVTF